MSENTIVVRPGETILDRWVAKNLVGWAAGKGASEHTKENLSRELKEYVVKLSGPSPSGVESLLAETAALSWFALRMHEAHFSGACSGGDGMSINQAKFHLAKIDRAHARLMSSLKTLAQIRRLALPAVQINVARQQVNQQVIANSTT